MLQNLDGRCHLPDLDKSGPGKSTRRPSQGVFLEVLLADILGVEPFGNVGKGLGGDIFQIDGLAVGLLESTGQGGPEVARLRGKNVDVKEEGVAALQDDLNYSVGAPAQTGSAEPKLRLFGCCLRT